MAEVDRTMPQSQTELEDAFRKANRRITPQRVAIFSYLARCDIHPSARKIYDDVRKTQAGLSLATVYNTLGTLVEFGLIVELDFEGQENRYDTRLAPHLNLVCVRCGTIEDRDQRLPVALNRIESEHGFATTGVRIEYRGICAACRNRSTLMAGGER